MAGFRLTNRAKADLSSIDAFTVQNWGVAQADRYLNELEQCFCLLGGKPGLGRRASSICLGLRRMEKGRHVIFFREEPDGILVCRILHAGMLPGKHEFEDD
jgi:toxin ParE1/3/4